MVKTQEAQPSRLTQTLSEGCLSAGKILMGVVDWLDAHSSEFVMATTPYTPSPSSYRAAVAKIQGDVGTPLDPAAAEDQSVNVEIPQAHPGDTAAPSSSPEVSSAPAGFPLTVEVETAASESEPGPIDDSEEMPPETAPPPESLDEWGATGPDEPPAAAARPAVAVVRTVDEGLTNADLESQAAHQHYEELLDEVAAKEAEAAREAAGFVPEALEAEHAALPFEGEHPDDIPKPPRIIPGPVDPNTGESRPSYPEYQNILIHDAGPKMDAAICLAKTIGYFREIGFDETSKAMNLEHEVYNGVSLTEADMKAALGMSDDEAKPSGTTPPQGAEAHSSEGKAAPVEGASPTPGDTPQTESTPSAGSEQKAAAQSEADAISKKKDEEAHDQNAAPSKADPKKNESKTPAAAQPQVQLVADNGLVGAGYFIGGVIDRLSPSGRARGRGAKIEKASSVIVSTLDTSRTLGLVLTKDQRDLLASKSSNLQTLMEEQIDACSKLKDKELRDQLLDDLKKQAALIAQAAGPFTELGTSLTKLLSFIQKILVGQKESEGQEEEVLQPS